MTQLPLSSSLEDYLEAIAAIIAVKGHAHTKDIADRLKVKMPSVTNALRTLSEKGLIEYTSHTPVLLTAKGADTADRIQRRHNILLGFFEEILCLGKNDSNDCACKITVNVEAHIGSKSDVCFFHTIHRQISIATVQMQGKGG